VSVLAGGGPPPFSLSGYTDGTGTEALFFSPQGIAPQADGSTVVLIVGDTFNNEIRQTTLDFSVAPPLVSTNYIAGDAIAYPPGAVDGPWAYAQFNHPVGVAYDQSASKTYIADSGNNLIRVLDASDPNNAVVNLVAGGGASGIGLGTTMGFTDGMGTDALFSAPRGVAFAANQGTNFFLNDGAVYVADTGNCAIRVIDVVLGAVKTYTIAGSLLGCQGGGAGNADGLGLTAKFNSPAGVAWDTINMLLYVADAGNNAIRVVTPLVNGSVLVMTLAGSPTQGPGRSNGIGSAANFSSPRGIALDAAGNLYSDERQQPPELREAHP
jgi:DNA-binding beta-propeller fold protein YncE